MAALSNNKLVFVYGDKVIAYVLIGVRYRHMEVEKEAVTEFRCLRVRHYQERIYVVCIDYAPYNSFVVMLNMNGMKVKKIEKHDFNMNFATISPSTNELFVTGINGGMKVFDRNGKTVAKYRDVGIQWYYGIASDKYGNVFVCTQDEFGPEAYLLQLETFGTGSKGLDLQLTAKEGLRIPYRLCYCRWNTTMDKPIHKREHNNCQQLITKSHGRYWLDTYIRKATPTLCKEKGHCICNVSVLQK